MQCNIRILRVTIANWDQGKEEKSAVLPLCILTLTDGDIRGGVGEKSRHVSLTVGSITLDDTSTPHTAYMRVLGPTQGTFTTSVQASSQPIASIEMVHNPLGRYTISFIYLVFLKYLYFI